MDNRVICVVGPTATGKTKMGVALAKRFGGEVVSVDSMQIYRGMTIGTAAPTAEEMEGDRAFENLTAHFTWQAVFATMMKTAQDAQTER